MHSHVHLQVSELDITVYIKVVSGLSVNTFRLQLRRQSGRATFTLAGCYKVTLFNIGQEEFRAPLNSVTRC